jgi:tRNA A-37 threonylcarbamoyl transferase component Bud32
MDRDLSQSRAILISNAVFNDAGIADLPAASGCTSAMEALLTSEWCRWPAERVETLVDVAAPPDLARKLVELTQGIKDVLLLYYVGHGMRSSQGGELTLALRDTSSNRALLRYTAIAYKDVADILRVCPAVTKLVILDCCHAELGNKESDQFQSGDIDAEPVDGLYCIFASKEWEKAKSPVSGGLTYFTDAFINVVRTGIPGRSAELAIDQIFVELRARLLRAGRPEPAQSGVRDARNWSFARNAAPPETHRDLEQENAALRGLVAASMEREKALRAESEGEKAALRAESEGTIRALRAEITLLKARASTAGTSHEKREIQGRIDTAERLLDDTIAGAAASGGSLTPSFTPREGHSSPVASRDRSPGAHDLDQPRLLSGRYELDGVVGRGGMAEVYRARDLRLDRVVAVKALRSDLVRNATFQARFRREAQSAASLNHPSIVPVYDTGEDNSTGTPVPYIVMEYVDGRTVRDLLIEGRLRPGHTLEIIAGVLRALEYSHQAGIVHRAIKPGNVMVTRKGDIKVMDFGIARAMSDAQATMTQAAQVIGTVQYMSPEQARAERVDARSDLYSTGCLMYELLTGLPPFTGDSPVAIASQHMRVDPIPPSRLDPDIPPWADAIVLKAMAKPPGDRYQSAAEMQADIQRAASGMQVAAMSAPPAAPAHMVARRPAVTKPTGRTRSFRRLAPAIGATVVITVAASVALLLASPGNPSSSGAPSAEGNRGAIVTSDNVTIGASRLSAAGDPVRHQRVYYKAPAYAAVTGYDSPSGHTGVEQVQNKLLSEGATVHLTINSKAQQAAYAGLQSILQGTGNTGGVVAINPKTGAILAMASWPSYDTNRLAVHDGNALSANDKALHAQVPSPLTNYASDATGTPGSTFNIVTTSAWFTHSATATPQTSLDSPQPLKLPNGDFLSNDNNEQCGNGSGHTPAIEAFAQSCNTPFAELGIQLGGDTLKSMADGYGFNQALAIPGIITTAASSYTAEADGSFTALDAIGQHDTTVTPLQEAMIAAAVADNGTLMKPYLIQQVTASDRSVISQATPSMLSQPITPAVAAFEKQMMVAVVTNGTAAGAVASAGAEDLQIAGTTGTAQNGLGPDGRNDAIFTALAPASNPTIAVGVIVQGGGYGAAAAAPIAIAVIKAYLGR